MAEEARESRSERAALRALAVFKFFKAGLLILLSVGAFRYLHRDLEGAAERVLNHLRLDPQGRLFTALIAKVSTASPKRLGEIGVATGFYGAIYLVEGVGLWMRKGWAEWLALASSALPLPFETYEMIKHAKWGRIAVLVINLGIVIYLGIVIWRKRKRGRA